MNPLVIETERLWLTLESTEEVLARIEAMTPNERAEVSPEWLARMRSATPSPWTHGLSMVERASDQMVGSCGYKGPPDADGTVEIAYAVNPAYQGRGYAKEAAAALVGYALEAGARVVRAHTLPTNGPSPGVLRACGFDFVGEVIEPEDGLVWRWELTREQDRHGWPSAAD